MKPYNWQQQQWEQLQHAESKDSLPHALLLAGSQGLGKVDFARALAASILCETPLSDNTACQRCANCHLLQANTHPDFLEITPEEKSKNIKIAQIRMLLDKIKQTSHGKNRQVVILHPLEAMNIASSNALLKLLEEPPGQLLFILISNQLSSVLPTITSRSQIIPFTASSLEQAQNYYNQLGVSAEQQTLLFHLTAGAPLLAKEYLESDFLAQRKSYLDYLWGIIMAQANPIDIAQKYAKTELPLLLTWMEAYLTDLVRINLGIPSEQLINSDQVAQLQQLRAKIPLSPLYRLIDKITMVRSLLLTDCNPNKQMILEDLLFTWMRVLRRFSTT